MQNRPLAIAITAITALCCGCLALFACIWGAIIASGQPIETTVNGFTEYQTLPQPVGFALLCLSCLFILIPVGVGFFTLRQKPVTNAPGVVDDAPMSE